MKKTQEQKFLQAKEKLDYYRLPTIFPIEATDLLLKLLNMLSAYSTTDKQNIPQQPIPSNQLNSALRLQINKVVKENNRLHLQLINNQEQIQALKFNIEKHQMVKMSNKQQNLLMFESSKKREDELFQELQQIKFKYNELMDLIHQDPNIEKKYLKRLLKHKKYEVPERRFSNPEGTDERSRKIGQHETVTELEQKVSLLREKVTNRESEIMRLQKKIQYDGLNMNKILKDFQNDRTNKKVNVLEDQVKYLEDENKKMKAEVRKVRKQGGLKEALREETRKNHETIKQISQDNRSLKRKLKEKNFDGSSKQNQFEREVKKVNDAYDKLLSQKQLAQLTIQDLQKKIEFLQKELSSTKIKLTKEQDSNINKEIIIDQMKNTEEGGKILSHYEIQDLKKKLRATEELLAEYEAKIHHVQKQNSYYKDEGLLKSEAIENLQRIVDELMKRDSYKGKSDINEESLSTNIEQAVILKKELAETRHLLAIANNSKFSLEQELQNLRIRYDQRTRQSMGLSEEISKLKNQIYEIKRLEGDQFNSEQGLRNQLRKEQGLRNKIQALHESAQSQIDLLKRELKEVKEQYQYYERKTKKHLNENNNEKSELVQTVELLQIRLGDKQKKINAYEQKIDELQNKITILRDEVSILEDEKHGLLREKQKIEKRYEETARLQEQERGKDIQFMAINENEVTRFKKLNNQLNEKIAQQNQEIIELREANRKIQSEKQLVMNDKVALLRQNDALKSECNNLERRIISANSNET